jgi:indole-3-glycerol phosphate synthase
MLNKIVQEKRREVAAAKVNSPLGGRGDSLQSGSFALTRAIRRSNWALIAECKLASPAKGRLCSSHTVPELARLYTDNGATALSVHTSRQFCGALEDIAKVRAVSHLPILCKDFMIDDYQLYEARRAGADAVLLIAAILTDVELNRFLAIAEWLGMDSLVEVHSPQELDRVQQTRAELVGINNRNLQTFVTNISTTFALLPHCDSRRLIISESGISDGRDASRLKQAGVRGILVGESLVTAADIAGWTRELAWPGELAVDNPLNQVNKNAKQEE